MQSHPLSFQSCAGHVGAVLFKNGTEDAKRAAGSFERNLGWDAAKLYREAQDVALVLAMDKVAAQ